MVYISFAKHDMYLRFFFNKIYLVETNAGQQVFFDQLVDRPKKYTNAMQTKRVIVKVSLCARLYLFANVSTSPVTRIN